MPCKRLIAYLLVKDGSHKHKWPATSSTSIQFGFITSKTDWDHEVSIQIFDAGLVGKMSPLSPHSDASPDNDYGNQDMMSQFPVGWAVVVNQMMTAFLVMLACCVWFMWTALINLTLMH
jgi:hypothetical protein